MTKQVCPTAGYTSFTIIEMLIIRLVLIVGAHRDGDLVMLMHGRVYSKDSVEGLLQRSISDESDYNENTQLFFMNRR